MEKTESIQSIELKKRARRRLTGATALVMVATVVLPMILDKQPKPLEPDVVVKIPPLNTTTTLNANLDLPVKTTPLPSSEANANLGNTSTQIATNASNEIKIPDVVNGMPTIQTNPDINPENPKEKQKTKEKEAKKSEIINHEEKNNLNKDKENNKNKDNLKDKENKDKPSVAESHSGDKKYTIKLGTFTNDENAQKLKTKVGQSGVSVFSESVKNNEGQSATRVRAGPFNSKEEAQKALSKLESMGISGGMVTSK